MSQTERVEALQLTAYNAIDLLVESGGRWWLIDYKNVGVCAYGLEIPYGHYLVRTEIGKPTDANPVYRYDLLAPEEFQREYGGITPWHSVTENS